MTNDSNSIEYSEVMNPITSDVLVIDGKINGLESLLSSLPPTTQPIILDHSSTSEKIIEALSSFKNLKSLHIFTHAEKGIIHLGKERISEENLGDHEFLFKKLGAHFSDDADLMIYGCDLGQYDEFMSSISKILS